MNKFLQLKLAVNAEQSLRLLDLQKTFALACDETAKFVIQSRSWHRVTLHHLAYKSIREQFPSLGSQMVCNAIHTVSRACKEIFQDPQSRWADYAKTGKQFPQLKFSESLPVFFDKHTLAFKKNALSIYTLDGRMHIQINLSEEIEKKIRNEKIKELSMVRLNGTFFLRFVFGEDLANQLTIKPSIKVISENKENALQ